MPLNGPASLWWELPQGANDPPLGWFRFSVIHVLPDTVQAEWQPIDEQYTHRYAALYNEAKDQQADALRQQHEARWQAEFAARQRDFHFFFPDFPAVQQFAAACAAQSDLSLAGRGEGVPLTDRAALLCPQLELSFGSETIRRGLFGLGRQQMSNCTLILSAGSETATQHLNPARVAMMAAPLLNALAALAAADPAALRDQRALGVVEAVIGAA